MYRCLIFTFYSLAVCLTHVFVYIAALYSVWFIPQEHADSYDYVIVGAGTAGTTIMTGMRSGDSVLLIEAGRKTHPSLFFDMPIVSPALQRTDFDWSYETVPQTAACWAMNDRKCRLAAGRGYGGSNILNNMIYSRGHPEDYRGWFSEPERYNYSADIEPLFRDIEAELTIVPLRYQSKLGQGFAQGFRSKGGKVRFESVRVIQRDDARWSPAHSLWQNFPLPKNHHLLLDASVRRLLFDDDRGVVIGIEFEHFGQLRTVRIRKAAILSAGTIGSPILLQRSGIGSCRELERLSIPCRADLPAVGSNFQDHLATGIDLISLNTTVGNHLWNMLHPISGFNYVFGTGPSPWSTVGCEALGFRLEDDNRAPGIGFMAIPIRLGQDGGIQLRHNINLNATVWQQYFRRLPEQTVSIVPIVLRPKSRGFVRTESNGGDRPAINPRYLTHPADIETLIDGIRLLRSEILKAPQLQRLGARLTDRPFSECSEKIAFDSHAYWRCYVRHMSFSIFHSVGTCRMGGTSNSDTVVGRDFRVKGFRNLFVADASIMPNPPSANTNAAVMMIAKKFLNQFNSLNSREEINVARNHDEL